MKCRAMRIGGIDESEDIDDIKRLVKEIGLTSVRQAFDLVTAFYPDQLIEPKTRFGLEEIFERFVHGNKPSDSGPTAP
jgi:hypothetical protein